MSNLEIAKQIISDNVGDADCGIFDCVNIAGDPMTTIYDNDGLRIDICMRYLYFEVFGLSNDEFDELERFYYKVRADYRAAERAKYCGEVKENDA